VLAVARRNLAHTHGVTLLQADVRRLPLPDGSVDVAHVSLLMHHLSPSEAVAALAELRRVAREGVVVNDLRRGLLPYVVTAATVLALTRGTYTRHDGLLSARRAYTLSELDDLAAAAGLSVVARSGTLLPRVTTVYR
jgi:ubiquinone/menaquinone biosynthesis C-methylase UbiE